MAQNFSGQLGFFMRQAGLPLRRVAQDSGIPHQTIHNWLRGVTPRLHPALSNDLRRLGAALSLTSDQTGLLLQLAGCQPAQWDRSTILEVSMNNAFIVPKGWFITGEAPNDYDIGLDPTMRFENRPCVTLRSHPDAGAFGTLAQTIKADAYRGKRMRYSAALRTENVENVAALWMRIDGPNGKMLAFDNMLHRQISGTNDWQHHAIVLDVDEGALSVFFGVLLAQNGQVWMADVRLEEVGQDIPTTDITQEVLSYFPVNLGFDEA